MKKKLTLLLDSKAIVAAKRLARRRKTSVSRLVEEQFLPDRDIDRQASDYFSTWKGAFNPPRENQLRKDARLQFLTGKHISKQTGILKKV